jgi:hypothetical protein
MGALLFYALMVFMYGIFWWKFVFNGCWKSGLKFCKNKTLLFLMKTGFSKRLIIGSLFWQVLS